MPKLRPYQETHAKALASLNAAGCFNEPRTGKTPISLAAVQYKQINMLLIVCPASMVPVWCNEIKKWTGRNSLQCTGPTSNRRAMVDMWNEEYPLIISYESLRSTKLSSGTIHDIQLKLNRVAYKNLAKAIIVDEAHRIKDRKSSQARAIFSLKNKFNYKLALTATPSSNKSYDIWSILHFLYPNTFSSYWKYIYEHYAVDEKYNPRTGGTYPDILHFKPGHEAIIQKILSRISIRCTRKEVMPWLPDKVEATWISLDPTKQQIKYLTELQKYYETENVMVAGDLDRLIRYRQICAAPALLELDGRSPKIDWVLQYCKDYPDKSIIIFSKFTKFIKLLHEQLDNSAMYIGATKKDERQALIEAFQTGKLKRIIVNIDAGKEGITLDRADTTIFCDRYPPVGDLQQAEDRYIATTPEKAKRPKAMYNLVLKNTYDEELNNLIEHNITTVDAINNFAKYMKGD